MLSPFTATFYNEVDYRSMTALMKPYATGHRVKVGKPPAGNFFGITAGRLTLNVGFTVAAMSCLDHDIAAAMAGQFFQRSDDALRYLITAPAAEVAATMATATTARGCRGRVAQRPRRPVRRPTEQAGCRRPRAATEGCVEALQRPDSVDAGTAESTLDGVDGGWRDVGPARGRYRGWRGWHECDRGAVQRAGQRRELAACAAAVRPGDGGTALRKREEGCPVWRHRRSSRRACCATGQRVGGVCRRVRPVPPPLRLPGARRGRPDRGGLEREPDIRDLAGEVDDGFEAERVTGRTPEGRCLVTGEAGEVGSCWSRRRDPSRI